MNNIRNHLNALADAIEGIQQKPTPRQEILDRELSGNKIHGGTITQFASVGISDKASEKILVVSNDGIHVSVAHIETIKNPLTVEGDLTVKGTVHATRMHVDELVADVRNERTDPLAFIGKENKVAFGKGLIWPGGDYTKQFILQERPDRFFATESLELRAGKIYMINGQNVLAQDELGRTVTKSHLKKVGVLENLSVDGNLNVDNFIHYDAGSQRFAVGTSSPNGTFSVMSLDHEFIVDGNEDGSFRIGSYSTTGIDLMTDDTVRISINATGVITVNEKTVFKDKIGVGVKNFSTDADITTAGPVRFQNKKFEVADEIPTSGNYVKGDIVWNSDVKPSGNIGWVCIRSGSPGDWKAFGQIAS